MEQKEFWQEIYSQTRRYYNPMFIISGEILTFILTLNYSVIIKYDTYASNSYQVNIVYAFLAMLLMVLIYYKLSYIKNFPQKVIENISLSTGWGAFLFAIIVCYRMLMDTQRNYEHILTAVQELIPTANLEKFGDISNNVFLPMFCILSFFSVFILLLGAFNIIKEFLVDLYKTADKNEKIYFLISFIECFSLICFFYSKTWVQWNSVDLVYQADPAFVYYHYYPVLSFGYDFDWDIGNGGIRHPLATLYTYPLYVMVSFLSNLLFYIPQIQPILYSVIQSIMIILTVIMLKRMVNNNWIFLIFNISFPFIFFSIFIEKYQIATFFIVLFVYTVVNRKEKDIQRYSLIAASGIMITSAWLGFYYGKRKRIATRFREYAEIVETFLAVLIGSGRFVYLVNFPYLLNHNFKMFNGGEILLSMLNGIKLLGIYGVGIPKQFINSFTCISLKNLIETVPKLLEKICSFFNMMASCLIPIPYEVTNNGYADIFYWSGVKSDLNLLGIAIFILISIITIRHRKKKIVQISAMWVFLGILQFVIVGFSAGCSPLFSLYFSWAVISLLLIGLKDILKRPMQQLLGYGIMAFIMFFTNLIHLQQLYKYMLEVAPL